MCCIIGGKISNVTEEDLRKVRRMFEEGQIRGMHATGMSVFIPEIHNKIHTIIEPIPGSKFVQLDSVNNALNESIGKTLIWIGHCRYSTSDIRFNQPIFYDKLSVVHNGVISQRPKEEWSEQFPRMKDDYETGNDSEILFKCLKQCFDPIEEFPDASIAAIWIDVHARTLSFMRNGKRPLSYISQQYRLWIASTDDILKRALGGEEYFSASPEKTIANYNYAIGFTKSIFHYYVRVRPGSVANDLQSI